MKTVSIVLLLLVASVVAAPLASAATSTPTDDSCTLLPLADFSACIIRLVGELLTGIVCGDVGC